MTLQPKQTIQQRLILAPSLTLALEVLHMTTLELREFLQQQSEENPLLELEEPQDGSAEDPIPEANREEDGTPSAKKEELADEWLPAWEHVTTDADPVDDEAPWNRSLEERVTRAPTLYELLKMQLGCQELSRAEERIGETILRHLNEHGYLEASVEELAGQTGADREQVERILRLIQRFDPPGIAARDLRECLMIQLEHQNAHRSLAYRIVRDHFPLFAQQRLSALASATRSSLQDAEAACAHLKQLNPKPTRAVPGEAPLALVPDLIMLKRERHDDVELNDQELPQLHINATYYRMLRNPETSPDAKAFLLKKFRQARWVIKAIDERQATLLAIGRCLLSLQRTFVEQGPAALNPLTQSQVAQLIGRHASTVSRAIAGKTIDTPYGIFRLEQFFASGVPQRRASQPDPLAPLAGNEPAGQPPHFDSNAPSPSLSFVSDAKIKSEIQHLIEGEDAARPLSDEALAARLGQRNITVARRTIAKYRSSIKIPPAHLRKRRF
ncbi:MAG: RNA polymerase factor sigma-54 [Candidatus Omnitrophica bacterium]|nr:RNA polymerase factor sigma-54 [Candidatus Omnitrophota bacterium]